MSWVPASGGHAAFPAGQVEMVSLPVCMCGEKSSKACWLMFSLASYTSLSWSSRRTTQWSLKGDPSCAMLMFCQAGEAKLVRSDENIFWWCGTNILFLIIPQNGAALEIRLTRAKFNHRVTGLGACILGYRVSYFLLLFSVSSHFLRDCKAMGGSKIMKCGKCGQRKKWLKHFPLFHFYNPILSIGYYGLQSTKAGS